MAQAVFVKLTAQPGKRDELVAALMPLVEATRSEEGTLAYALHEGDEADTVWFYELYADAEAAATHSASDTMKAVGPQLASLLGAAPMISRAVPKAGKGLPGVD